MKILGLQLMVLAVLLVPNRSFAAMGEAPTNPADVLTATMLAFNVPGNSNPTPTLGWKRWRPETETSNAALSNPMEIGMDLQMTIATDELGNHWATISKAGNVITDQLNLAGIGSSYVQCVPGVYETLANNNISFGTFKSIIEDWEKYEVKHFTVAELQELNPGLPERLTTYKRHFLRYANGFLVRLEQMGLPADSAAPILKAYKDFLDKSQSDESICFSKKP